MGKAAILFYLLAYSVTNLAAFGAIALLGTRDRGNDELQDYAGLWHSQPALAALICGATPSHAIDAALNDVYTQLSISQPTTTSVVPMTATVAANQNHFARRRTSPSIVAGLLRSEACGRNLPRGGSRKPRMSKASSKDKIVFACTSCGASSPRWMGRCASCGEWNDR